MKKKTSKRNWRIFRVKGIIATAKQIAKETEFTAAHVLVDAAEDLYHALKENT